MIPVIIDHPGSIYHERRGLVDPRDVNDKIIRVLVDDVTPPFNLYLPAEYVFEEIDEDSECSIICHIGRFLLVVIAAATVGALAHLLFW